MAYDEGLAELIREDLVGLDLDGLVEKRMFGGICFMSRGNMICGVHKGGVFYRVGKPTMPQALAMNGVGPMVMGDKLMGGFVDAREEALDEDATREGLTQLAIRFHATLPAK